MSPRKRDEPVRLTKIYTRGGDAGETSLGDGSRVSKLDARIAAYGAVDELNAQLGVLEPEAEQKALVLRLQNELFDLGADLSVPYGEGDGRLRVTQAQIDELERLCDEWNADLPELRSFVLPGGNPLAAQLHVARTVCRRAALGLVLGTLRLPLIVLASGSPLAAAGTNIAISAAAAGSGALRHAREGRVDWRVVAWMAPPSVAGAVAGAVFAR